MFSVLDTEYGIKFLLALFFQIYLFCFTAKNRSHKIKFPISIFLFQLDFISTNQKHFQDLGSVTSSVWNFCPHYSDVVLWGLKWWPRETSAVFSGYWLPLHSNLCKLIRKKIIRCCTDFLQDIWIGTYGLHWIRHIILIYSHNTYILFDGLTYNTRGYFVSCMVFFRAPKGQG